MTERPDSSLARMLQVLDLFTDQQMSWSAEGIAAAMQVSLATGYRHVRMLTEAGLLQRTPSSQYTLGPRIMVLDNTMRRADPVLQHAIPFMKELVALTGFDCVISGLHGQQIIDSHHELSAAPSDLSYGRGRPRPLFKGAAPKVILAALAPAPLRKVFEANTADIVSAGLPSEWSAFRKYFLAIQQAGHYTSMGEVEPHIAAIAVPLSAEHTGVQGALALVTSSQRMTLVDTEKMVQMLQRAAKDITSRM